MSKIAVALSGGVDSSLIALILRDQGHEVHAVTLKLQNDAETQSVCAGDSTLVKAKQVADFMGIPHHIYDLSQRFHEIILRYAKDEYANARTPSPCIVCNERIKFGLLLEFARSLGCSHLATGHYVRRVKEDDRYYVARGKDLNKDQSYFLARLSSDTLSQVLFPLGEMQKSEVRQMADKYQLPSAQAPDSQNICISRPDRTFAETLWDIFDETPKTGAFVLDGKILGQHKGVHRYTVGQRRGLGDLVPTKAVWVKEIQGNQVHLSTEKQALNGFALMADNAILHAPAWPQRCKAQIRYRHKAVEASLYPKNELIEVHFDEAVAAITPGQAIVFYEDDKVIGQAWIRESL